jgi:predicted PurR-regulated permease PerM
VHVDPGDLGTRFREGAANALGRAASAVATIASVGAHALLTLLFIALSTFFVLLHWRTLTIRVERMLPLHPLHTRRLFREARTAGRGILLGTLVTGLAQGALAALGYRLFGVEHALLLGAVTAIASLVPAVGTLLVWGPIAVFLIASGRVGSGIGLLVYCSLAVIGVCDFLLRPLLVGRAEKGVPSLITFIAIFGGIEVFGVVGLVLGPVLVSVCLAVLRTWEGVSQGEETVVRISRPSAPSRPSRPSWSEERTSH